MSLVRWSRWGRDQSNCSASRPGRAVTSDQKSVCGKWTLAPSEPGTGEETGALSSSWDGTVFVLPCSAKGAAWNTLLKMLCEERGEDVPWQGELTSLGGEAHRTQKAQKLMGQHRIPPPLANLSREFRGPSKCAKKYCVPFWGRITVFSPAWAESVFFGLGWDL